MSRVPRWVTDMRSAVPRWLVIVRCCCSWGGGRGVCVFFFFPSLLLYRALAMRRGESRPEVPPGRQVDRRAGTGRRSRYLETAENSSSGRNSSVPGVPGTAKVPRPNPISTEVLALRLAALPPPRYLGTQSQTGSQGGWGLGSRTYGAPLSTAKHHQVPGTDGFWAGGWERVWRHRQAGSKDAATVTGPACSSGPSRLRAVPKRLLCPRNLLSNPRGTRERRWWR